MVQICMTLFGILCSFFEATELLHTCVFNQLWLSTKSLTIYLLNEFSVFLVNILCISLCPYMAVVHCITNYIMFKTSYCGYNRGILVTANSVLPLIGSIIYLQKCNSSKFSSLISLRYLYV